MAMEEPWPGVISLETDCDVIPCNANGGYITQYRIIVIVGIVPCAANDIERMAMEMDRML